MTGYREKFPVYNLLETGLAGSCDRMAVDAADAVLSECEDQSLLTDSQL